MANRGQRTRYPVPRDSRIALSNSVRSVLSTETNNTKKHKNMDLNAYVLAMAIVSVPRHKKNRQAVPEPEFEPFDIRDLRGLSANTSQPRQSCHQGKTHNNVSEALPA